MKRITIITFWLICSTGIIRSQQRVLKESFNSCTSSLPAGWLAYSVSGSQHWECTSNGYDQNAIQMNGYDNGNYFSNEDWLITLKLNISSYHKPLLRFFSRSKYPGTSLQLFYSLNYSGTGNPSTATWTPLAYPFPAVNSDEWDQSELNLTTIKSSAFHLAFKYISTNTSATHWRLDEIEIIDSIDNKLINLGQTPVGTPGTPHTFQFIKDMTGGNYSLQCQPPFELSSNNSQYSTTLNITNLDSAMPYTVYVRCNPTVQGKTYRDDIHFFNHGEEEAQFVHVLGSSLPDSSTLTVASWNMRWFGYPSFCNCDTALARKNASGFLKSLKADVYCLQEVVNIAEFNAVVSDLGPPYVGIISPFSSLASSPSSGYYSTGQKLAYIINTQKIQNAGTFGLLKSTYPSDTMPYYCFSSGRFPFVMKSVFQYGNHQDTVLIVNLHAKAEGDLPDYQRRLCGAEKMKDSLNALFPNHKILIIGDYNDYLEGSSANGQTLSPYATLLSNGYHGISLPSLYPGQSTFVGSEDHLIDNIMANTSLIGHYVDSSFYILRKIEKLITNYASTTSDHYPILIYWVFGGPSSVDDIAVSNEYTVINPSDHILTFNAAGLKKFTLNIYDFTGRRIYHQTDLSKGRHQIQLPGIPCGIYLVEFIDTRGRTNLKWFVNK